MLDLQISSREKETPLQQDLHVQKESVGINENGEVFCFSCPKFGKGSSTQARARTHYRHTDLQALTVLNLLPQNNAFLLSHSLGLLLSV